LGDGFCSKGVENRTNVVALVFWYVRSEKLKNYVNPGKQTELRAGLTTWVSLTNFILIPLFTWAILGHEGRHGLYCKLIRDYRSAGFNA
jgi:hypothetical protein